MKFRPQTFSSSLLILSLGAPAIGCSNDASDDSAPQKGRDAGPSGQDASFAPSDDAGASDADESPAAGDAAARDAESRERGDDAGGADAGADAVSASDADAGPASNDAIAATSDAGVAAPGCGLAEDDFAIAGTVDGTRYEYSRGPSVVATSETHLTVTVGELERWRLIVPKAPGTYACGEVAGETSIELLLAPDYPTTFSEKGTCTLVVESTDGFVRGSFEASLVSQSGLKTFPTSGCFNVPNGGTLAGAGDALLPAGAGATINVTRGNGLIGTGTGGALESTGSGDQRAMEQMYGNFAGTLGTPPVAGAVNFLGLPYAPGTYRCGEPPVVDGRTLFAVVSLVVNVAGAYRADTDLGACEIVLTGGEPDFEATYSGTFVSGEQSIEAEGRMRFPNPQAM